MKVSFSSTDVSLSPNRSRKRCVSVRLFNNYRISMGVYQNDCGVLFDKKIVDKIRGRKIITKGKINPHLARTVVKMYILPVFGEEKQYQLSKSRSTAFGFKSSGTRMKNPEKLSEKVRKLVKSAEETLEGLKNKLEHTQKTTQHMKKILRKAEMMKIQSEIVNKTQNYYMKSVKNIRLQREIKGSLEIREKLQLQKIIPELWLEREKIRAALNEKTLENSELIDLAGQFNHRFLLLNMKSSIVGESLKGIFESFLDISSTRGFEDKIRLLTNFLYNYAKNLFINEAQNLEVTRLILPYILKTTFSSINHSAQREKIITEIRKFRTAMLGKINNMVQEISLNKDKSEEFIKSKNLIEKKINEFTEDYNKTKLYLVEAVKINEVNEKNIEKICDVCNAMFNEGNNYNWSCKKHASQWNGTMYWCCGKVIQSAVGCIKQKHIARGKNEIEEAKNDSISLIKMKIYCVSCRKNGHLAKDCLLDPNSNVRTKSMTRIKNRDDRITYEKSYAVYKKSRKKFRSSKTPIGVQDFKESLLFEHREKKVRSRDVSLESKETGSLVVINQSVQEDDGEFRDHFPKFSRRVLKSAISKGIGL